VAEAVAAYQARVQERLRQAEVAHAQAQVKITEERKRRRVTLALAVAVVLLLGSGGVAGWWYQSQQADMARKQALTEQAVRQSLDQAQDGHAKLFAALKKPGGVQELLNQPARWELQIKTAHADWQRAKALAASAEGLEPGLSDRLQKLDQQLARDQADYELVRRLEKIRLDQATWVEGKFDYAQALREYPQAFQEVGLSLEPGREQEATQRIGQSALKEQLLAALDNWAWVAHKLENRDLRNRLLKVARLADPDPWRDRVRDSARWNDPQAIAHLAAEVERDQALLARLSPPMLNLVSLLLPEAKREAWLRLGQGLHPGDFWLNFELAFVLARTKAGASEAAGYYRVALALRPNTAAVYNNLGIVLQDKKDREGALAAYQKALALDPKLARAWNNLGNTLRDKKDREGAFAAYQKALDLDPKNAKAWYNLGLALAAKQDLAGALAAFQKALDLDPKNAKAWYNFGVTLKHKQDLAGAIATFQKALDLDPKDATAWNNLGTALRGKKDREGAIAAYQKALDLDPKYAMAWYNLGLALAAKQDLAGAIAAFQKALDLDPKYTWAWNNLGLALAGEKDLTGAIAAFQKALDLDPKLAFAWNNLGTVLRDKKDLEGALAAFQKALDLDPKFAMAWNNLGLALRASGEFAKSLAAFQSFKELAVQQPAWKQRATQQVALAEHLLQLEAQLPKFLQGEQQPDGSAEASRLLLLCAAKKLHTAAVGFARQAFDAQPELAGNLQNGLRYNAACSAALAGCGQSRDAPSEKNERLALRQQALAWLRADLKLWAQLRAKDTPKEQTQVRQTLQHWQKDPDLAGVRDEKALAKLPEEERKAWQKLWGEVETLLKKAAAANSP
jgi:tetratricopeptide (TPR) repeat protein